MLNMANLVTVSGNCDKLGFYLSYIIFSWLHIATDLPLLIAGRVEKRREQRATSGKMLTNWPQLYIMFLLPPWKKTQTDLVLQYSKTHLKNVVAYKSRLDWLWIKENKWTHFAFFTFLHKSCPFHPTFLFKWKMRWHVIQFFHDYPFKSKCCNHQLQNVKVVTVDNCFIS